MPELFRVVAEATVEATKVAVQETVPDEVKDTYMTYREFLKLGEKHGKPQGINFSQDAEELAAVRKELAELKQYLSGESVTPDEPVEPVNNITSPQP